MLKIIKIVYIISLHTHTQRQGVTGRYQKKTLTHSHPSWSSHIFYQLPPFAGVCAF